MSHRGLRLLCPNGHLGFAPIETGSFYAAVETRPDFIIADSGSCDIGPGPLASDISSSPVDWQRHDLEEMLVASRKLGVPMIIGSAGDTGANSRVDLYVQMIRKLAEKHGLPRFRVGYFYSEVRKEYLEARLAGGERIEGLGSRSDLTMGDLQATDRIVGVAGIHPFVQLLDSGADVIIGGRCGDAVIFAAPAIRAGYPESLAYCLGKAIECSSFCAEPYAGKESVIGEISMDDVRVTAFHPMQRCTVASVSGHMMYERPTPFYEYVLGGVLDLTQCRYEQFDAKTCRITGPRFTPSAKPRVKLEGAGRVGERYIGSAAIRDPLTIANIHHVIQWAKDRVLEKYGETGYELYYHLYGMNGVMGDLEPVKTPSHEVCLVVEAVAPTKAVAEGVAMMATRQLFYGPRNVPGFKGTAGGVAFLVDEVLQAKPACKWTINHTMSMENPLEVFPVHVTEAGV